MTIPGRIVVLDVSGVLAIQEIDFPDPGPHQVNVEILAASIGQQQLHQVQEPPGGPLIMGGEAAGTVVAVGEAVTRVALGDTVVVVAAPVAGREPDATPIEMEEGMGEHVEAPYSWATNAVLDEQYLVPMPVSAGPNPMDRESRCLFGQTAPSLVEALVGRVAGKTVAVFGAQGSGVTAVAVAAAAGAGRIVAVDASPDRLAIAAGAGAGETIEGGLDDAIDALDDDVDVVVYAIFEFDPDGAQPGADLAGSGAVALVVGEPGNDQERDRLDAAIESGFTHARTSDVESAIAQLCTWVDTGAIDPSLLTSTRFTIEQVNEAVQRLEDGRLVGMPILVIEPLVQSPG